MLRFFYRDPICSATVDNLFKSAKNPKIFVGICQQNSQDDTDCITQYTNKPWFKNIRIIHLKHTEAKGPTYARYLCSTLFRNEDFFFQIDSHTKFLTNWDQILINDINILLKKKITKPILSHYPKDINEYKSDSTQDCNVPTLCTSFFNDRGMISYPKAEVHNTKCTVLRPTAYVSGGMIFAPSKCIIDVPFDPYLDYLFVGEEILHSIRFYTHGWDFFTPSQNVVYHEYTRKDKPKIWGDLKYSDVPAHNKVKKIIGLNFKKKKLTVNILNNIHKYGLGTARSLSDYYNYAGINIDTSKVNKNFCK